MAERSAPMGVRVRKDTSAVKACCFVVELFVSEHFLCISIFQLLARHQGYVDDANAWQIAMHALTLNNS